MLIEYTTDNVSRDERFDYWHRWTCESYSETQSLREPHGDFSARGRCWRLGAIEVGVSRLSSSHPLRLTRSSADTLRDRRDNAVLLLSTAGGCRVAQDGREACLQSGDMTLYSQARPFEMEVSQEFEAISLNIPKPLAAVRLADMRHLTASRLAGGSTFGSFAADVLRRLLRLDDAEADDAEADDAEADDAALDRIGASTIEIVAAAFIGEGRAAGAGSDRLLERVKDYMRTHLDDGSLDIEAIARAQNIAPRTLNRLFAAEGVTPIRWLWQQRLVAAYRALEAGQFDRVTDAAFAFGFNDVSHFGRSFKKAFGMSPQSLKRR